MVFCLTNTRWKKSCNSLLKVKKNLLSYTALTTVAALSPHEAGEACAHSGRLPARPLLRLCPDLQPERQPCVCALQDVPPPGGYPAVRTARNLPKGGASAMVMALGSAFIYTWGMYKIIKANQTRRCRAPPPWRCAGGLCSPPELCGARRQGVEA